MKNTADRTAARLLWCDREVAQLPLNASPEFRLNTRQLADTFLAESDKQHTASEANQLQASPVCAAHGAMSTRPPLSRLIR